MTQMLGQLVAFLGANQSLAILFAFLVAFGEALLIIGLFVPSTVVLVGIGTLIGLGKMALLPVFAATVAGAIAGDALSFWAGVHWKDRIRSFWPFSRYAALMATGERFVARHGGKSIFIVRFIPGVKAVVPTIAGMMGMSASRFAVVNVVSAFAWAAVHLFPAILLGRGLRVANAANPRFMILAGLAVAVCVAAWLTAWVLRRAAFPAIDRARLSVAGWLVGRGTPRALGLARVLRNEDGAFAFTALAGVGLLAISGFVLLVAGVALDPQLPLSDAAMSRFVQGLRTDWGTSLFVGITMLGDTAVLLPVVVLICAALAWARRWSLAGAVAAAAGASAAFVPMVKAVLHRGRPVPLYDGADQFSFPSGHSTQATVIFGILALLLVRAVPDSLRSAVYAFTAMLIVLVAFSRVYLLAHWPSDVLAGLLFGSAVVTVVAMAFHRRDGILPRRAAGALAAVVAFGIVPLHLWTGYAAAYARYDTDTPATVVSLQDWVTGGWRSLPAARVPLDGEAAEPMILQTDLTAREAAAALRADGWAEVPDALVSDLASAMVPSRAALAGRAPWPLTHLGRQPVATFVKADGADRNLRYVMRLWASDTVVADVRDNRPILLASITADSLDPVGFGFGLLEQAAISPGAALEQSRRVIGALAASGTQRPGPVGAPALIAR